MVLRSAREMGKKGKNPCTWEEKMYRQEPKEQIKFEEFYTPFGGHLRKDNRWVKLAELIPWEELEDKYAEQFSDRGMGAPAKQFRMALGALIIKEKLRLTDEEVVEQIRENVYMQYLVGMEGYQDKEPFEASMMVHFRKRISMEMLNEVNRKIHEKMVKKKRKMRTKLKKKKIMV